ncbi:MAG: hypothetical protein P8X74_03735 [Reinekea sp.]
MICILKPFPRARDIKPKGADIVEVLQCYTIDEIKQHFEESKEDGQQNRAANSKESDRDLEKSNANLRKNGNDKIRKGDSFGMPDIVPDDDIRPDNFSYPFKILGIADNGDAYFLNYSKRMVSHKLSSLTENKLIELAGLQYLRNQCGGQHPDKKELAEIIDNLMHACTQCDFDIDRLRGRGAWRTKSGEISYFDGKTIIGTPDPDWIFVRRPKKKIGIGEPETNFQTRAEIFNTCKNFTFAANCDISRLLGWATIAPFGGALKWRPAGLLNGKSGTGKSTIVEQIVNPIANPEFFEGNETTEPGIRESLGIDSYPVVIDEADPNKEKGKNDFERFYRIISAIKTATTDNSPKTAKGTGGKGAMVYRMRSMFFLAAINASFSNIAEDNRIIRINLEPRSNAEKYAEGTKRLAQLLTFQNCQGIRSYTWNHINQIVETAEHLEHIIQKEARASARYAAGESIILSSFMHTYEDWNPGQLLNDDFLTEYIGQFYFGQQRDEERDESDEIIGRLLDELVVDDLSKGKRSLRDMLTKMKIYLDSEAGDFPPVNVDRPKMDIFNAYKRTVEQHGVTIHPTARELFIRQNHYKIMQIIDIGKGYHRQLLRHANLIMVKDQKTTTCRIDGATQRGVVIGGQLEY